MLHDPFAPIGISPFKHCRALLAGDAPAWVLGSLAKQAGVPASLHGTGGAWLFASSTADHEKLGTAVECSLDRKVCNTLNVICLARERVTELLLVVLGALGNAARKGGDADGTFKLHIAEGDENLLPQDMLTRQVKVQRASGECMEQQVETIKEDGLATEWEWEKTPEVSLKIVDSMAHAADLFNMYSPQFVASCIGEDVAEQERFFSLVNAPFICNGMTRWVDGQYALDKPELGLSNWEGGRLFGRGGVLSGDSVFTVRTRVRQTDPGLRR